MLAILFLSVRVHMPRRSRPACPECGDPVAWRRTEDDTCRRCGTRLRFPVRAAAVTPADVSWLDMLGAVFLAFLGLCVMALGTYGFLSAFFFPGSGPLFGRARGPWALFDILWH